MRDEANVIKRLVIGAAIAFISGIGGGILTATAEANRVKNWPNSGPSSIEYAGQIIIIAGFLGGGGAIIAAYLRSKSSVRRLEEGVESEWISARQLQVSQKVDVCHTKNSKVNSGVEVNTSGSDLKRE